MAKRGDDRGSLFVPRFTLVEVQYPQIVAGSVGIWMLLTTGRVFQVGPVADLEVGLSGPTIALGVGATSAQTTSNEHVSSFGLQGALHRTWPWWDPLLPTSATFAGVELFGHFFAVRCSLGLMWNVAGGQAKSSPFPVGGCGLGLP